MQNREVSYKTRVWALNLQIVSMELPVGRVDKTKERWSLSLKSPVPSSLWRLTTVAVKMKGKTLLLTLITSRRPLLAEIVLIEKNLSLVNNKIWSPIQILKENLKRF